MNALSPSFYQDKSPAPLPQEGASTLFSQFKTAVGEPVDYHQEQLKVMSGYYDTYGAYNTARGSGAAYNAEDDEEERRKKELRGSIIRASMNVDGVEITFERVMQHMGTMIGHYEEQKEANEKAAYLKPEQVARYANGEQIPTAEALKDYQDSLKSCSAIRLYAADEIAVDDSGHYVAIEIQQAAEEQNSLFSEHAADVASYQEKLKNNEITMEEVPEAYRQEIKDIELNGGVVPTAPEPTLLEMLDMPMSQPLDSNFKPLIKAAPQPGM